MKRYYIITFGCQMNKSDSERLASILEKTGYKPVRANSSAEALAKADLIVVNMCSVRQSAVDRVYGLWPKFKKLKARKPKLKTILTGCILKKDKKKFGDYNPPSASSQPSVGPLFDSIWNLRNYFDTPPKCKNKFLAFVPISNGCNNFCTYCVVPYTRGNLICRPHQQILKEVKSLVQKGFKEIWLLGQNVNDYQSPSPAHSGAKVKKNGAKKSFSSFVSSSTRRTKFSSLTDPKINFAKLLKMVNNISGDFKILFTSPNPKDFSKELINALAECEKFGKYLNLPVQSGDDEILKKMNRSYTVKEYKNLVKEIRKKVPAIRLSTDVIVGFPGETKKQFEETVKLFKEIKFDNAYISKYSPRPETAAFNKMKDNISLAEKKRREKKLREIIAKNVQ